VHVVAEDSSLDRIAAVFANPAPGRGGH
jgi:hypothetical protein